MSLCFSVICNLKFKALLNIAFFAAINQLLWQPKNLEKIETNNELKTTNHNWQMWPFDLLEMNCCFPTGPLWWLMTVKSVTVDFQRVHVMLHVIERHYKTKCICLIIIWNLKVHLHPICFPSVCFYFEALNTNKNTSNCKNTWQNRWLNSGITFIKKGDNNQS